MSNYKPTDSKREEFRKYLEKAGVMDSLTKVLVALYEEQEKPNDALEYVKKHLGGNVPDQAELESLKAEVDELKEKLAESEQRCADLQVRLDQYEPQEVKEPQEE